MDDLQFTQAERRSFRGPILGAIALLILLAGLYTWRFPSTRVQAAVVSTQVLPTSTVYKSDSIVVGPAHTETVLFVATTLKVDNQMQIPVSVDGLTLTLTDPSGAQLAAKAATRSDIEAIEQSFPKVKPMLVSGLLMPDAEIPAGQKATGVVLFSLQVTQAIWDQRKSAEIAIDLYHQPSVTVVIPK
jgi:hypothetical protein